MNYPAFLFAAPAFGIPEDPATGAASGPLGACLVKYGLASAGDIVSEQGIEMGRPSFINIHIGIDGDAFTDVRRRVRLHELWHTCDSGIVLTSN